MAVSDQHPRRCKPDAVGGAGNADDGHGRHLLTAGSPNDPPFGVPRAATGRAPSHRTATVPTHYGSGAPLKTGLCFEPARVHGLGQGLVIALVLVGVGTGEVGDGLVEDIAVA